MFQTRYANSKQGESQQMGGEILNAGILSFGLIFAGWAIGALLLKIQAAGE
jgi:cytochrome b6-f complex subunit 7